MKKIDIDSWERKSHYSWFSSFADPSLAMDVKMDITRLLEFCKKNKLSSSSTIMYVICCCINNNTAFRLRILNNEVYEIDTANVAYTMMANETCFVNCRAKLSDGFSSFINEVKSNQQKYHNNNYIQEEYNDISVIDDIYCSCTPWVNFLSVRQPIPDKYPESKSIPRVCWGKYFSENQNTYMTLNITVNHALVDGIDLANVFNDIQSAFNNIESFIDNQK